VNRQVHAKEVIHENSPTLPMVMTADTYYQCIIPKSDASKSFIRKRLKTGYSKLREQFLDCQ
jgi:hypothetical protein